MDGSINSVVSSLSFNSGKNKYLPFPLQERINISHDTILVRFQLPTPEHVLGLPLGQHILLQAQINGEMVARAYTPTTSNLQKGSK